MSIRINSNHKDVKGSIALDPNEFWSKMKSQFGGFPITLSKSDVSNLNTVKGTCSAGAAQTPWATIVTHINNGETVTVEPSTPQ